MALRHRTGLALALSGSLLAPIAGGSLPSEARPRTQTVAVVLTTPPSPVPVREPLRVQPRPPASNTIRPKVTRATPAVGGRQVVGPAMVHARGIDSAVAAARRRLATPVQFSAPPGRAPLGVRTGAGASNAARRSQSLPGNSVASGTGVNPWWTYREQDVPGGGHVMINVGSGNLMLQDVDMAVPHKGIDLNFRRTYNSQMPAVTPGSYTNWQSLYGNGWTNSLDAHIVATSTTTESVYDVDGARYDYVQQPAGNWSSVTAGQHAVLAWDGACGMTWTKKDGTIFYFIVPMPVAQCPYSFSVIGGFAGRMYGFIGRNRNVTMLFTYSWDGGISTTSGKISHITVTAESGLSANLTFADVNGRRLLQQLTFPDGNAVSYAYDSLGNLTSVTRPSNNTSGSGSQTWYGYTTVGSDNVLAWTSTPRWAVQCNNDNCGGDGEFLTFAYSGATGPQSTVSSTQTFAQVNFAVPDGLAPGALQGTSYPTYAYAFHTEYYTTGVATPTFRDTDGHAKNWVVDPAGRPTQIQRCTVSTSPCPAASLLTTGMTWDADNNIASVTDPRGGETDFSYDAMGNVTEVAQPLTVTSVGTFKPTQMYDYDAFNNVVGYCDQTATHLAGYDWNGSGTTSDSPCSGRVSAAHSVATFTYPSYEPYGRMAGLTSPTGYARTFIYDLTSQAGTDYGLPTSVSAPSVAQFDQSTKSPGGSQVYDTNGNIICSRTDTASSAWTVMAYDAMNRLVASSDPDDATLTSASCAKTAGLPGSAIVTRKTYFPNGELATSQTPSEAAASYGTAYAYDPDDNPTTETLYHPTPVSPQTATMSRWFDGAGRLVETLQPADPNTSGDFPLATRFIYDLSQGGSAATLAGPAVVAHGNLFDVRKNTPTGWIDFKYSTFDGADRITTDYAFAPCPAVPGASGGIYCSQPAFATRYDWDTSPLSGQASPGKLVAVTNGLSQSRVYSYDSKDDVMSIAYLPAGGTTPNATLAYDANGRLASATNSAAGTMQYTYRAADGALLQVQNPSVAFTASYNYYTDGTLAGVSSSAASSVNVPNLYQYSYRNDGKTAAESFGAAQNQKASYSYTPGGRMTATTDFNTTPSITKTYDAVGRPASYGTPAGSYNSITYDFEGRLLQYSAFQSPFTGNVTETVASRYDVRGDLVGRTFQPQTFNQGNGDFPAFQYRNVQGVLVQNASDQYDGRTGAPLALAWVNNTSTTLSYDAIGRMTSSPSGTYAYDTEDRLVAGDLSSLVPAGDPNCMTGGQSISAAGRESSYSYDAVGNLNSDVFTSGSAQLVRQWYWDRGKNLYTTTTHSPRQIVAFSADGMGYIGSGLNGGGLTFVDRDFDGAIMQHHNGTGNSAWWASNAYHQECISANPVPASGGYQDLGNPVPTEEDPGSASGLSESLSSTGRVVLSRAAGFTTPDYSSSTPYAALSNARSTLGATGRPMTTDNTCPTTRLRFTDGNKECVTEIGGVISKRLWQWLFPGGPLALEQLLKTPNLLGRLPHLSQVLCNAAPVLFAAFMSTGGSDQDGGTLGNPDGLLTSQELFQYGLEHHPSGKDVENVSELVALAGLAYVTGLAGKDAGYKRLALLPKTPQTLLAVAGVTLSAAGATFLAHQSEQHCPEK